MKTINSASYLALLGVAAFSVLSVGCAAVEEVGEGIEEAGDEIEDAADDARR
jgi:predicted small secreted protein